MSSWPWIRLGQAQPEGSRTATRLIQMCPNASRQGDTALRVGLPGACEPVRWRGMRVFL